MLKDVLIAGIEVTDILNFSAGSPRNKCGSITPKLFVSSRFTLALGQSAQAQKQKQKQKHRSEM
jgi:hypothetical protein